KNCTGSSDTVAKKFKKGGDVMKKDLKTAMSVYDDLLGMLWYLMRLFEKGVDEVVAFFKKITDDFFDWLEDMFKKGKADEVLEELSPRKKAFMQWSNKFDKSFFNHLDGEWGIKEYRSHNINLTLEYLEGQGGHNANVLGKNIRIKKGTKTIPDPPFTDLPFKANIEVRYKSGKWLEKPQSSSMFPENWSLERIQEEVAFVYENTVAKGVGLDPKS